MKHDRNKTRSINRDAVRHHAEERKDSGGGSSLYAMPTGMERYVPEKGKAKLDILPYEVTVDNHPQVKKGDLWYERTIGVHFGVGPEEKAFLCPRVTVNKPCPICEEWHKLRKDPNADEATVKALRPKERQIFNVNDVENSSDEVQLWDVSTYLFGKKLEEELREGDDSFAGFPDLVGGKTLQIRFNEESMGKNTFMDVTRIDFLDREQDYGEDILEKTANLDKILKVPSYEELQKAFLGLDDDAGKDGEPDADGDEPEEKPPAHKKPARPDPDEDDGDEPEEGGHGTVTEDDDDLPMGKSKKSTRPEPEEDEDEPEDDEGDADDDDEPPAKPVKKGKAPPPSDDDDEPALPFKPSRRREE